MGRAFRAVAKTGLAVSVIFIGAVIYASTIYLLAMVVPENVAYFIPAAVGFLVAVFVLYFED